MGRVASAPLSSNCCAVVQIARFDKLSAEFYSDSATPYVSDQEHYLDISEYISTSHHPQTLKSLFKMKHLENKMRCVSFILLMAIVAAPQCSCRIHQFLTAPYKDSEIEMKLVLDETSTIKLNQSTSSETEDELTPVVFWHGMGDTAWGSVNIDRLALQKRFPGIKVFSIQIGNSVVQDELAGYFTNVNQQVSQACDEILKNEIIKRHGSFNGVGFSQGAQFLRALVQRCPLRENGIRIKNLISLGGQHQGVFGLPNCISNMFCDYIRYLLTHGAYEKDVQAHLVQAEYWHDPLREEEYREKNVFLADINNERDINSTYRTNIMALENFVLVQFLQDEMVVPRESSLFGFYKAGQTNEIVPLRKSRLYLEDRLGLRALNESERLKMISVPGRHLQYKMTWFLDVIAAKYLDN